MDLRQEMKNVMMATIIMEMAVLQIEQ